jgi:hypothetical protein
MTAEQVFTKIVIREIYKNLAAVEVNHYCPEEISQLLEEACGT